MPLRPWTRLPNIRQYYGRFLQQVLSDSFAYFWGQVVSGFGLGIAAVLLGREVGWVPNDGLWRILLIASIPYVGIVALTLAFNAIRAPVKLDNHRASLEVAADART